MSGENAAGRWIARVLKFGSYSSALLMAAGLVLALFRPAAAVHYRLADLGHHLLRLDPTAVMQTGIAMLLATPVVRIVVAIIGFARERDYRYVWISSGVLLIVISSILFRAAL